MPENRVIEAATQLGTALPSSHSHCVVPRNIKRSIGVLLGDGTVRRFRCLAHSPGVLCVHADEAGGRDVGILRPGLLSSGIFCNAKTSGLKLYFLPTGEVQGPLGRTRWRLWYNPESSSCARWSTPPKPRLSATANAAQRIRSDSGPEHERGAFLRRSGRGSASAR